MNNIEIAFKHIPVAIEFEHKGQEYIKTNFMRGYYWKEGRKVFRYFRKRTKVNTTNEYFNIRG